MIGACLGFGRPFLLEEGAGYGVWVVESGEVVEVVLVPSLANFLWVSVSACMVSMGIIVSTYNFLQAMEMFSPAGHCEMLGGSQYSAMFLAPGKFRDSRFCQDTCQLFLCGRSSLNSLKL